MSAPGLSSPGSKAERLQRAVLDLLRADEREGALPTPDRFLFYELVQAGVVDKRPTGERRPDQDVSEASFRLRDMGVVPWSWVVDETRELHAWGVRGDRRGVPGRGACVGADRRVGR
jgi:hypothetical protein